MANETAAPSPEGILAVAGGSGLKQWGGYVKEEWHPKLQGKQAVKMYREMMDNHPIIGATFAIVDWLLRGVEWSVEKSGDTPEHQAAADFCQEVIEDMEGGIKGVVSEALTMMGFGWCYVEKVYKIRRGDSLAPELRSKYNDGRIGWRKLAGRAQESLQRWEISDAGDTLGMWQLAPPKYKLLFIPRNKALHFRIKAPKNNPEGRSMLRNAYTSYYFQKNMQFTEAVGVERNLAGLPVINVPPPIMAPNANTNQAAIRSDMENIVQKIRLDEMGGLVFPSELNDEGKPTGYKFSLISSSGKNVADADPIIKRYASWIAISLLSEFLLLGMDKVGSFALSSDKTEMFALALGAVLDCICDEINECGFPDLMRLNGWSAELSPKLVHGDIETPNITEIATYVSTLAGAGAMVIDTKLEEYLRKIAGLPQVEVAPAPAPQTAVQATPVPQQQTLPGVTG